MGPLVDLGCSGVEGKGVAWAADFLSSRSPHSRKSFSRREARAFGEARRLELGV